MRHLCDEIDLDLIYSLMQGAYGLPRGSWPSDDAALAKIRILAQDPTKGGGIWGMRFQAGLECGGKARRIGCSAAHDDKHEGISNYQYRLPRIGPV